MINCKNIDFCTECRKQTQYNLEKRIIKQYIKEKEYEFEITVAVCTTCGEEMSIPGLLDNSIREIDEQYRKKENLVSVNDIEKFMSIYNIGKAPLSLVLGFGEITITRYLMGQIPSKEYSDIIRSALSSPSFMKKCLLENKEKIALTAYKKAMNEVIELEKLFSISEKMIEVISYLFNLLEEITPLTLQKLLYFIQGVSFSVNSKPMFDEECQAWVHGPVFPKVYHLFRNFKYNPIDDIHFAIIKNRADNLTKDEKKVIELVAYSFGIYGGKTLEKITHKELPWIEARAGLNDTIPSSNIIEKEKIEKYYIYLSKQFKMDNIPGILKYIDYQIN